MALLSARDRKVMEEAQQRGSDPCGRVNMPPPFMQSQPGAGGRRGDPSQRAMSEPLEWPWPGQRSPGRLQREKTSVSWRMFFLSLSADSHSCLFWAGACWRALGFSSRFSLEKLLTGVCPSVCVCSLSPPPPPPTHS